MSRRYIVDADQRTDIGKDRQQVANGGKIRTDGGDGLDPQADNPAIRIKGEFGIRDIVATVFIRLHGLGAVAGPFDGAPDLARGP